MERKGIRLEVTDNGLLQLIDESVALWSKMVFEEARQKHQIVMNAKDIQQASRFSNSELQLISMLYGL